MNFHLYIGIIGGKKIFPMQTFDDNPSKIVILPPMKTVISSKGQIVLPAEIRQRDGIKPGQQFDVQRVEPGEYRLLRTEPLPNEGLLDWLLACPAKGFFTPIPSESTNTL
jgi:AbrB family looped-hinge helix DNA binding protein